MARMIPRVGPGNVVPLGRVAPQDVGSGAGQAAYSDAADTIARAAAHLQTAEQTARVAQGVAAFSARLEEERLNLATNPNHDEHEKKFEQTRGALLKEFREQVSGEAFRADFDRQAFQLGERAKLAVREGVTRQKLEIARAGTLESYQALVDQAGRAPTEEARLGLLQASDQILDGAVRTGVFTPVQRVEIREAAAQRSAQARVVAAIRSNPVDALRELNDPKSELHEGLDELQRQHSISAAEDAVKAREAEERARLREAKAGIAEVHEAALQDGLDLLEKGELTADWLTVNADALGSANRIRLRKMLSEGPKAADPAELNRLNRLAVDNPAAFGAEDLDPAKLGQNYTTMLTLQRKVRENGVVDSQTQSLMTRVNARAAAMSLDDAETMEFDRRVNEEIEEFITRNGGKRPDRAQQDAIVDGLSLEVRGSKGFDWFGMGAGLGRAAAEGQSINGVPGPFVEILADDLEDQGERITTDVLFSRYSTIAKDLQANSLPVTEDNVARWLALERQLKAKP